jgi:predicted O-linked N-acetylglucosamine transferase (SPINDLY family)
LRKRFVDAGVAGGRLELHDRLPRKEFNDLISRIDIALDPFPYGGTTTTCDLLWMGVPVISLSGVTTPSRSGVSLLSTVGLGELVARTAEEYLEIAAHLARDPPRLAAIRAGLRERMRSSPLMDAERFTRNLESAYRGIWRRWCAGDSP